MKKIVLVLVFFFLTAVFLGGCGKTAQETGSYQKEQLKVYTSIYPLYDFTKHIAGDKIVIKNIVPTGSEPHDWEPTPQDVAELSRADLLILSGTGVEPWAEKVLNAIDQSKVTVINGGQNIELIEGIKEENDYEYGGKDPHVWLDPLNAKVMVDNILAGLIKIDEKNKGIYEINAEAYKKELDALHNEYLSALAQTKIKEFVTSHAAFGYLAKRYGLTQIPVRGLSAESEPSPADMAAVIQLAREKNIKHIFFETLVSPKVSETIANELQAETMVLDPVEGLSDKDITAGHDYLYMMRQNLKNLKIALATE